MPYFRWCLSHAQYCRIASGLLLNHRFHFRLGILGARCLSTVESGGICLDCLGFKMDKTSSCAVSGLLAIGSVKRLRYREIFMRLDSVGSFGAFTLRRNRASHLSITSAYS